MKKLKTKLGLSQSRVYQLIDKKVRATNLPRNVAALLVASDGHINFSRFATESDLAMMRAATSSANPSQVSVAANGSLAGSATPNARGQSKRRAVQSRSRKSPDTVFLVHGRNTKARNELADFLRSLNIKVIEWSKAVALTKKPNPYIGQVIDAGFENAQAIVVLLTPDDEAKLKDEFVRPDEQSFEGRLRGQPRQNVLFEAGMALGKYNKTTVLVQIGKLRPMSDVAGIHIQHLSDSASSLKQFVEKLKIAGVVLDDGGDDWLSAGKFGSV